MFFLGGCFLAEFSTWFPERLGMGLEHHTAAYQMSVMNERDQEWLGFLSAAGKVTACTCLALEALSFMLFGF